MTTLSAVAEGNIEIFEPHPLNDKVYGDAVIDEDLKRSIQQHGVLTPIIVDRQRHILSGHRRWMAAKELGHETIPAYYFDGTDLEAEAVLIENNRQRVKTAGQITRETAELFRIEQALSAERMKAGTPVSQGPIGSTRGIVAEKTGQGSKTVEKQVHIVKEGAGNPKAVEALASLDKDAISVAAAHRLTNEWYTPVKYIDAAREVM